MPDVPEEHVSSTAPIHYTGMDVFGPLNIKALWPHLYLPRISRSPEYLSLLHKRQKLKVPQQGSRVGDTYCPTSRQSLTQKPMAPRPNY